MRMRKVTVDEKIVQHAFRLLRVKLARHYRPDLIVLPLTPDAEAYREWIKQDHYDPKTGWCTHESIDHYGSYEYNFYYEGELYLAIIVNND